MVSILEVIMGDLSRFEMGQCYGLLRNVIKLVLPWRLLRLITLGGVRLRGRRHRAVLHWVWCYYNITVESEDNYYLLLQNESAQ